MGTADIRKGSYQLLPPLMRLLYSFFVRNYGILIRVASLFHAKARKWINGRKGWHTKLKEQISTEDDWIWVHCASLGEFEQGRPLIEKLKSKYPKYKILLSFYSPSGYEIRKNYAVADYVCYMPLDTRRNAKDFLETLNPKLVFFVKYEIWVNFCLEMKARETLAFLVSANVREDSKFVKSAFRRLYQNAFGAFRHIFVQNPGSGRVVSDFVGNPALVSVAGDTRFDRVCEIADGAEEISQIREFVQDQFIVVCGSTWPKDEEIILEFAQKYKELPIRWIIAPHEIHRDKIDAVIATAPDTMLKYSDFDRLVASHRLLWIDNIGMLSRLYQYGSIAFIGGGFGAGVHNTLEAAVFGNPVAFGPNFSKFQEIHDLIQIRGGFPVTDLAEFESFFFPFYEDAGLLRERRSQVRDFVYNSAGATQKVLSHLEENKLI